MKSLLAVTLAACIVPAFGQQGHDLKPAEALKLLSFMKGHWSGTQNFNNPGGPAFSGKATNNIDDAIGERYLCEMLSTTMTGRKPTDTRHFITYDAKSATYKAWWFTDTSVGPMEFEGKLIDGKLELTSKPSATGTVLKATYANPSADKLTYTLEMKQPDGWLKLFVITYGKMAEPVSRTK